MGENYNEKYKVKVQYEVLSDDTSIQVRTTIELLAPEDLPKYIDLGLEEKIRSHRKYWSKTSNSWEENEKWENMLIKKLEKKLQLLYDHKNKLLKEIPENYNQII